MIDSAFTRTLVIGRLGANTANAQNESNSLRPLSEPTVTEIPVDAQPKGGEFAKNFGDLIPRVDGGGVLPFAHEARSKTRQRAATVIEVRGHGSFYLIAQASGVVNNF